MAKHSDPERGQRRSTRLKGFDCATNAGYVVTLCTSNRRPLFGTIKDGQMHLSAIGEIVQQEWQRTAALRPGVQLDEFIVMPNHLHGILILDLPARASNERQRTGVFVAPSRGVGAIVRGFKAAVISRVRRAHDGRRILVWQRDYFDRVIRNDQELRKFQRYIAENAQKWELDRYYPSA